MPADSVQMQLVRRYTKALREKQASYRGPRIGARGRREARETALEAAEDAAQTALSAVKPQRPVV